MPARSWPLQVWLSDQPEVDLEWSYRVEELALFCSLHYCQGALHCSGLHQSILPGCPEEVLPPLRMYSVGRSWLKVQPRH